MGYLQISINKDIHIVTVSNATFDVLFTHSGASFRVTEQDLEATIIDFFENYGAANILGYDFYDCIAGPDGKAMYASLLRKTGFPEDSKGFLAQLIQQLQAADTTRDNPVSLGGVTIPSILLVAVLETIMPGTRYMTVRNADQIQELSNLCVPESDKQDLNTVIERYPVRFSMHTIRQMMVSRSVAYQYLPFVEELDGVGHTNTWIGQFHQGLLEQMYQNRVIFLLNMSCPVYCRFCFRKHKDSRNEKNPGIEDVLKAVEHIKNSPDVKEIVVTGGDPYLSRENMEATIDGLKEIPHVQTLRLATRSVAYYPDLFLKDNCRWLNYLKMKNLELMQVGKRIEVATHFIHPDEVSIQSLRIISELVKGGIAVYIQTPFLYNCNDTGPELVKLFSMLRGAGAELHYIYIPCSPIHGNSVYWSPLSDGLKSGIFLRAHLSDRIIPRICTATPIGKLDWNNSGWAVEKDPDHENLIWLRSPYTPEYFNNFAPVANDLDVIRKNEEGTIDVRYMAKIGDESLFLGSRPARPATLMPNAFSKDRYLEAKDLLKKGSGVGASVVPVGSTTMARVHKTRVELDTAYTASDIEYIRSNRDITDVVLVSAIQDPTASPAGIRKLAASLREIQHVNSLRIRSLDFTYAPGHYTTGLVETLGSLNTLTIANPLRIDIEAWVLHSSEFSDEHQAVTEALYRKGITVYFNIPLITAVNDTEEEIQAIAFQSRKFGMQCHHVYVSGLGIQKAMNKDLPVDMADVIDIATRVRRNGSGREIPAYILLTDIGEADYGLSSRFHVDDTGVSAELLPYSLDYFTAMDPAFTWPESITTAENGIPVTQVPGLKQTVPFPI